MIGILEYSSLLYLAKVENLPVLLKDQNPVFPSSLCVFSRCLVGFNRSWIEVLATSAIPTFPQGAASACWGGTP